MQDDKYKVKYGEVAEKLGKQKVLLALSGGESSLVLLDIMSSLLQEQFEAHKGRQGFELVVVNLDEYKLKSLNSQCQDVIPKLLERYTQVKLSFKVLSLDSYIDQDTLKYISLNKDFTGFVQELHRTKEYTLNELLESCQDKSSAEDLLSIVYESLILKTAEVEGCETIVYGHSMTRIANEIIALTIKGRGSIIHKAIADHTTTYNNKEFKILFPLRDVLYVELLAYAQLAELTPYILISTIQKSKITKNLTIRDLTTNYFKNLDATGYASTASTVVKTGEKNITVNDAAPVTTDEEMKYLELFKASLETGGVSEGVAKEPVSICYACIVTLSGVKKDNFIWPVIDDKPQHDTPLQFVYTNDEEEKKKVLDEFILTDDEEGS
ncbi:uncharacterized protein SPAPADRAFT_59736 [Spathaspora passalidarum NRRL Y-27907]|uniref:Cytoplasmic tRNA 2-thiolation protein 2 n=1 Tax=Spathaspora passalidarum (strain NRRL Y-27907 / 11-Y1) TaxID=619300 RepID=G3AI07_SPAPN|nr:uncharacterized protein SPAPADRAFT_59736 [Spathaspora passalidarum NRRL Y-27907]EGW34321.1 hypothetical protein SPAPADRAFT_59736 [Spathaspora passalidarum NRRL Y-27907]